MKLHRLLTNQLIIRRARSVKMSWRCSGNTNGELVDNLVKNEIVKSSKIANVMKEVDRGLYTKSASSYMDAPQSIGYGVTISAPHMVRI